MSASRSGFRKLLSCAIGGTLTAAAVFAATAAALAEERFTTPDDLALDLVLSEPIVRQPVFINFDERGRLWVVQYLQYPAPAGLKVVSRDNYWRAAYDKVPLAPPNHERGDDKITIHEDTDGDGVFDDHKTFLDGLNIVTAVARGRGGVWVLNPPYLLFYPDKDNDDVPDGDPEVQLSGFGLEDTHSVVNSLCWGPDGWLYAAQGSTVSGHVLRPGLDKQPVHSMGQLIWRYHPEQRRYEIFAEGGGNAFGVEIDAQGRDILGPQRRQHARLPLRARRLPAKRLRQAWAAIEPVRVRLLSADATRRDAAVHAHVCEVRGGRCSGRNTRASCLALRRS